MPLAAQSDAVHPALRLAWAPPSWSSTACSTRELQRRRTHIATTASATHATGPQRGSNGHTARCRSTPPYPSSSTSKRTIRQAQVVGHGQPVGLHGVVLRIVEAPNIRVQKVGHTRTRHGGHANTKTSTGAQERRVGSLSYPRRPPPKSCRAARAAEGHRAVERRARAHRAPRRVMKRKKQIQEGRAHNEAAGVWRCTREHGGEHRGPTEG